MLSTMRKSLIMGDPRGRARAKDFVHALLDEPEVEARRRAIALQWSARVRFAIVSRNGCGKCTILKPSIALPKVVSEIGALSAAI